MFPKGFEPPSLEPESNILSIELREQGRKYIEIIGIKRILNQAKKYYFYDRPVLHDCNTYPLSITDYMISYAPPKQTKILKVSPANNSYVARTTINYKL